MKKILLNLSECHGLGDLLSATPVIRKISYAHQSLLTVISPMPEVFTDHPCVELSLPSKWFDAEYAKEQYIIYNSFYNIGQKNAAGVEMKHNVMDIRQFHAANLGFQLLPSEMHLDFFSADIDKVWHGLHLNHTDAFEKDYIVIHPVNSWPSRTWNQWSKFIELFFESYRNIHIIAVGKSSHESGFHDIKKDMIQLPSHFKNSNRFYDLRNQTSLKQTHAILSQAKAVVSMDSGIIHLAATTEVNILQLGSSIHPAYRKVYRNTFDNHYYVSGDCQKYCASDMFYGVQEWGTIQGVPPLIGCLDKLPEFKCHPTAEKVIEYFRNFNIIK